MSPRCHTAFAIASRPHTEQVSRRAVGPPMSSLSMGTVLTPSPLTIVWEFENLSTFRTTLLREFETFRMRDDESSPCI